MKNIYFYGPPGSGKTTLGKFFAGRFSLPFADLDHEIVRAAGGKTIPEIFAEEGEEGFRLRELDNLRSTSERIANLGGGVISLGGGALLNPEARKMAESFGKVIRLDVSDKELYARVARQRGSRPLANAEDKLKKLLEDRKNHYESFTSGIAARFSIDSGDEPSDVFVGSGFIDLAGDFASCLFKASKRAVVVCDANTYSLYADRVVKSIRDAGYQTSLCVIPAGEEKKDISTVSLIWKAFLEAGLGRKDFAVALGGGVTGDLTGFAAATWMRGINWMNIPTTLLAMVDASTGGKTGCDLPEGKNLVGAFHSPRIVLSDVNTLSTLPERELKCGLAESVKHALIADPGLLEELPSCKAQTVARSLAVKVRIVTEDAREKGERAKLNLGHTVGHAVEIATDFAIKHGEAVAIGTVAEARIAVEKGLAPVNWPDDVARYFKNVGLESKLPEGFTLNSLKELMRRDKKRAGDTVTFALPVAPGDVRLVSVDLS
jgi:3-dehydroquinate synthase